MFEKFLEEVKRAGEIVHLDDATAYCDHFDRDVSTQWGTASGPASSPPEIDYEALDAKGLIMLPPETMTKYRDGYGEEDYREALVDDARLFLGDIIPFSFYKEDLKVQARYVGEFWGAGVLEFKMEVTGDEAIGRTPATY